MGRRRQLLNSAAVEIQGDIHENEYEI